MSALPHHSPFALSPEEPWHDTAVMALHRAVFGPGRFSRTAYRVRESIGHHRDLSLIARRDGRLVGSVRMTRIEIGGAPGALLGPIAVGEDARGEGLGTRLVAASLDPGAGGGRGLRDPRRRCRLLPQARLRACAPGPDRLARTGRSGSRAVRRVLDRGLGGRARPDHRGAGVLTGFREATRDRGRRVAGRGREGRRTAGRTRSP